MSLADNNKTRRVIVQPQRGVIFDENGEVLVRNKPAFAIELNTQICRSGIDDLKFCNNIIDAISNILTVDKEKVDEQINEGKTVITVAAELTKEDVLPIESNLVKYPGLVVSVRPIRVLAT